MPIAGHEFSCPSCGAPHTILNPGIIKSVCEYCGTAVTWDQDRIQDAGKVAVLPEGFTRLYRGATGWLFKKRFSVLGRVRYSFADGFWDEWFLELMDGRIGWLTEDNHELALQYPVKDARVRPAKAYQPASTLRVDDIDFIVQEVGEATCIGVEGDLPKDVEEGETYAYVDASSPDGRYALGIEYDDEQAPTVFKGRWLKLKALKLDDEGKDW